MNGIYKHTASPWEVRQVKALTVYSKKTGCRIAQCSKDEKYTESQLRNARLIAAAPTLLNERNELLIIIENLVNFAEPLNQVQDQELKEAIKILQKYGRLT
jgi:hypothetical protein